ncbi:hydroxyethylthiazole kinase [Mycetocola spongiae]|uniref:hydroxyethylthiazole kinase n=1 Tax=Mycetocola spongiae TaxID=2859226 RepID=UPI001CF0E2AA|nr:hydroxyethylthiazole kinase [Mycetocola spongiae]UCR87864.1 hydroxyethylthiazole kinase [Mycetocola spongiae]
MTRTPENLISATIFALDEVRRRAPLIQNITNTVVQGFTANALLALGASPAMADVPGEAGPFAGLADGLLINLGTPHAAQREAAVEAVAAAGTAGTPWVLDPVAVGVLALRTELAHRLLDGRPAIIRGNASEILALAGMGAGGRGVDSSDPVEAATEAARTLARRSGAVVAVSGPVDIVTDGGTPVRLANGDELLTRITGGGCALGAVMAAFAAVTADPLVATVAAITTYCVAAELAATAAGPGSFAVQFLDALAAVDAADLRTRARIS